MNDNITLHDVYALARNIQNIVLGSVKFIFMFMKAYLNVETDCSVAL